MVLMAKLEIFRKLKLVGLGTNSKATHCLFTKEENSKTKVGYKRKMSAKVDIFIN